ncbi:MAG TPA: AMP-binding protein [Cyclobacteriaceae bacterium]
MEGQNIVINGTAYTYDQVARDAVTPATDFEKFTLSFCRAWLNGEQSFLQETSGSTGTPKQIEITRSQMITSARMTEKALGLKPHATSLVCLDTKYIAGKMMLIRSFVTDMQIIAVEPSSNPLNQLPPGVRIDFAAFVPFQLHTMMIENPEKLDQVKTAIVGGGKVNPELSQKLQQTSCKVFETFGMTETVSHIALRKLNGDQNAEHFEALPGVSLSVDERGCLVISAPFLANAIYTNDLVKLLDPGHFKWLGRWDNIINTGGAKVIPEEVESALKKLFDEMSWTHRFFITGLEDKILGHKVCLVIEGDEMPPPIVNLLKVKIKEQLPRFEVPKDIIFIKRFMETGIGKINRKATLNLFPAKSNSFWK